MSREQFERLLDLHRAAMVAQESAIGDGRLWPAAHAADSAFAGALQAMVTP